VPEQRPDPTPTEESAPGAYEAPAAEDVPNGPVSTSPGVPQGSPVVC
jgi:hypothetical protein